jgi:hypothetical protein
MDIILPDKKRFRHVDLLMLSEMVNVLMCEKGKGGVVARHGAEKNRAVGPEHDQQGQKFPFHTKGHHSK